MLGRDVVAYCPQDESPEDPVLRVLPVLLHCLLDFLNGLGELPLFEQRECPVPVTRMGCWVIHFRLSAYLNGLRVELVHVEEVSEVVVGVDVAFVQFHALLQVVHCLIVLFKLEIS